MQQHLLIPVLLVIVGTLAACGTQAEPTPTPTPEPTDTPVPTATPTPAATMTPMPGHPCFNLSEADCDVIVEASENASTMTSFNQAFELTFSATGLDPLTMIVSIPAALSFQASGSGPFTLDVDDMPLNAALDMAVSGTEEGDETLNTDVPLHITNDRIYLPIPGASDSEEAAIVGVPFNAEALGALELPFNLGDFLPVEAITEANPPTFGAFIGQDQLGEVLNPSNTSIAPFADYVRQDSTEMMGQTMYPFVFTLDVSALLSSPEFSQALTALSGAAPDDPTMSFAMQLLPTLLRQVESEMVITQYVGADDMFIHRLTVDFDLEVNIAGLLSSPGGDTTQTPPEPLAIDFMLDVTLSEINAPQTVTSPEDARLMTVEELQAALESAAEEVQGTLPGTLGGEATPEVTESAP